MVPIGRLNYLIKLWLRVSLLTCLGVIALPFWLNFDAISKGYFDTRYNDSSSTTRAECSIQLRYHGKKRIINNAFLVWYYHWRMLFHFGYSCFTYSSSCAHLGCYCCWHKHLFACILCWSARQHRARHCEFQSCTTLFVLYRKSFSVCCTLHVILRYCTSNRQVHLKVK